MDTGGYSQSSLLQIGLGAQKIVRSTNNSEVFQRNICMYRSISCCLK